MLIFNIKINSQSVKFGKQYVRIIKHKLRMWRWSIPSVKDIGLIYYPCSILKKKNIYIYIYIYIYIFVFMCNGISGPNI